MSFILVSIKESRFAASDLMFQLSAIGCTHVQNTQIQGSKSTAGLYKAFAFKRQTEHLRTLESPSLNFMSLIHFIDFYLFIWICIPGPSDLAVWGQRCCLIRLKHSPLLFMWACGFNLFQGRIQSCRRSQHQLWHMAHLRFPYWTDLVKICITLFPFPTHTSNI